MSKISPLLHMKMSLSLYCLQLMAFCFLSSLLAFGFRFSAVFVCSCIRLSAYSL
jgi:hypothetical protein